MEKDAGRLNRFAAVAAVGISACGLVGGAAALVGREGAEQHVAWQDQQAIDACKPLIDELPAKGLPTECRDVKGAMPAADGNLVSGMNELREAYLTPGRRADEQSYVRTLP